MLHLLRNHNVQGKLLKSHGSVFIARCVGSSHNILQNMLIR